MPKANLKRKSNSVICAVIEPVSNRQWSEVKGAIMEADSQEDVNSRWDVFTEIAETCPDWQKINRQRNRRRLKGNRNA